MDDIEGWLGAIGLERYAELFARNAVGLDVLADLGEEDLRELGVPLGDRKRLLKAIAVSATGGAGTAAGAPASPVPAAGEPERRQLTVMFCDLVGSVGLGERMDVEDYRDLLARIRNVLTAAVARYDGFVARHQGDGLLAYFGYPRAHENDAERAVRAALDAVEAVATLEHPHGVDAAVRVGVATGPTVVGDRVETGAAAELAAFGPTPNLAARLQGAAAPGSALLSETTGRLAAGFFDLERVEAIDLKGIDRPVTAYRVRGARPVGTRSEMLGSARVTPLVGRRGELALILDRWEQARAGSGQAVLVRAEPGTGKTRLVREVRRRIAAERYTPLVLFCSPYHAGSPLHPVAESLRRALEIVRGDAPGTVLGRLRSWLEGLGLPLEPGVPMLATLLGVSGEAHPVPDASPDAVRRRTLDTLVSVLEATAAREPLLLVAEDLHWADPTTVELLGLALGRLRDAPALGLLTFRPEFDSGKALPAHATTLSLGHLSRAEAAELARRVVGDDPAVPVDEIVERADGVPLYVEELARAALESAPHEERGVPETLQDALSARLDRIGGAKRVAQVAAVVGRRFSFDMLAAVVGERDDLRTEVDRLVEAGLLHGLRDGTFRFKHALVHDAAYASLLTRERSALHARAVEALRSAAGREPDPALLAHHYDAAGEPGLAAEHRRAAGEAAARSNALREAEANFTQAIALLEKLPGDAETVERRVRYRIALGAVQMPLHGFGSSVVRTTYEEARRLNRTLPAGVQEFEVAWGLWLHHQARAEFDEVSALLETIDGLAAASPDPGHRLQSHHASWTTTMVLGDTAATYAHAEQGVALYAYESHRYHAFRFGGHDPGVCAGGHSAVSGCLLGYPDRALARWTDAMDLATRLEHRASLGVARYFGTWLFHMRGEPERALALAEEIGSAPAHMRAHTMGLAGWALAVLGEVEEGVRRCEEGRARYVETGATVRIVFLNRLLAEAYDRAGRPGDAMAAYDEALARLPEAGDRWLRADLHRARGAIMARDPDRQEKAEAELRLALAISREEGVRALELRAATTLARFLHERDATDAARDLLAPVYGWFTEGADTADLRDAAAVLAALDC